ncbi:MAG: NADH-ubiquinone oxidoreductase-F iron-sulfur binding region domain-containing protein [Pseudomonadota bacterium]
MTKTKRETGVPRHPGKGKKRTRATPKGRQIDPRALAEVRALLGKRSRARDLLIEHLHRLQDTYHGLSAAHLRALAEEMRLSMAEIYEVATFYAHFDVVKEGEEPPPVTVRVCDGVVCETMGCRALLEELPKRLGTKVRVLRAPCMGRCAEAPTVRLPYGFVDRASTESVAAAVACPSPATAIPFLSFEAYAAEGGYALLRACLRGKPASEILETLDAAGLRGLGGAGFPVGRKWAAVRKGPRPRYLVLNADEGEPGAFKDRFCLERDPHRVLEGVGIAAHVIEADAVYLYLRDEYPQIREILGKEIPKLEIAGLAPSGGIHLRRGAGAYVCGEESAMLESLEGKRGYPRHRPPFAAQAGLFGRPTLIQNVETFYWLREILEKGAAWYRGEGRHGRSGVRLFSVSGRVRAPGVKRAPVGITARELIAEHCGGMAPGHRLKAFLPGGGAGGILPAALADLPLDFGTLESEGASLGSASLIVLSDRDDLCAVALNLLRFFEDESCGQCAPCRVGTEKMVRLLERPKWDRPLLEDLARAMAEASICGLGQTAPNPLMSLFRHFPDDVPPGET